LVLLSSPLFGRFFISLPFVNYGGVLADGEEARKLLLEGAVLEAKEAGASHIELRHQDMGDIGWSCSHRKVSMRLELPGQFEVLWSEFPSKLRSQVRRAQKEGMTVRIGGREHLEEFYSVFSRGMRDLGTPVYSKDFFEAILQTFPKESRICVVSSKGDTLAAGFLYGFRNTQEIPWASSDRRYNHLAPNMLLYSSALEYACQEGFQLFDFGRSTPGSGTYRFKEQWGARPVPLGWYYWLRDGNELPQLNPQNPKYSFAIKMWQKLPLAMTTLVGPRIVKYLP
jgi:FemAB-related protein (PEP-CTERM system-associated)